MKYRRPTCLADLQPVVLVGGKSTRFGSDKLLAPLPSALNTQSVLVSQPINALREVFGPRVLAVGPCSPHVAALSDLHLQDHYPNAGPAGGILTVLEWLLAHQLPSKKPGESSPCAAMVLSGDLANITSHAVRQLSQVALDGHSTSHPSIHAIWGRTTHPEPCIGIYFLDAMDALRAGMTGPSGPFKPPDSQPRTASLHKLILPENRVEVPLAHAEGLNINFKDDLGKVPETRV